MSTLVPYDDYFVFNILLVNIFFFILGGDAMKENQSVVKYSSTMED